MKYNSNDNKPIENTTPKYPTRNKGKKYPTPIPKGFQCFKCQRWRHKTNEFPNQKNIILRDGKFYYLREEVVFEADKNNENPKMESKL